MRRASTLLMLVVATSCQRAQKDPRIAENAAPHVVVRVIDRAAEDTCETDSLIDTLRCKLTPAQRIGCVYAETGEAIDTPLTRTRRETFDCNSVEGPGRVTVTGEPLRVAKFFVDPRGERVLLKVGDAEQLFLFFNGALLDTRALPTGTTALRADGTPDWGHVPTLIDVVPAHLALFSDADLDALTRATPNGVAALDAASVAAFQRRDITPDDETWPRLFARLPEARRKHVIDEVLFSIEGGEADAVRWSQVVPVPRERLIDALLTSISTGDDSEDDVPEAFNLLGRLAPDRLAPLACHRLEVAWFDHDTEDVSLAIVSTALAVIARERLSCPWVRPWLLRVPCAWQLREYAEDDGAPLPPLVSEKTRRWAIALELDPEANDDAGDDDAEDEGYTPEPWGALLLAAAYAQGPLPPEFELREARRHYRRVYAQPDDGDDRCRDADDEVSDWACELPVTMLEARRDGCAVTLDDARRVMTLRSEGR